MLIIRELTNPVKNMIYYPEQVLEHIQTLMCAECEGYGEYQVGEYDNVDYYNCEHCEHGWKN